MHTFEKIIIKPPVVEDAIDAALEKRTRCLKHFYRVFKKYIDGMPDKKLEKSLENSEKVYRINTQRLNHLEKLYIKVS